MSKQGMKFEEVQSGGEIFKFEKIGDAIEGTLMGSRSVKRDDGSEAKLYDIMDEGTKLWTLWGTAFMDARMEKVEAGQYVRIEYVLDEPSKRKGWSPMRVFKVSKAIVNS